MYMFYNLSTKKNNLFCLLYRLVAVISASSNKNAETLQKKSSEAIRRTLEATKQKAKVTWKGR